jgi:hypothetical protein
VFPLSWRQKGEQGMKVIKCMVCERQWFVHTEEWDNDTVEAVLSIVLSRHPNDHIPIWKVVDE